MWSGQIFITALVLGACTAWPFDSEPLQAAKREVARIIGPRATTTFDLSFTGVQGNTATTSSTVASASGSISASTTNSASGSQSGSQSGSGSQSTSVSGSQSGSQSGNGGGNNTASATRPSYDARLPPGGIAMVTPNSMAPTTYYKIKDWVTFAWNYTSLSSTPSAVDVLASCSANQATYTIALNQTIPTGNASVQTVLWDTGAYQSTATVPLLTETYTLIIYDAQSSISAVPAAGYLAPYMQFTFGMYLPQPYTPLNDWACATCSAAMSAMERQTMGFMLGMTVLTVLSFTWFTGVAGMW